MQFIDARDLAAIIVKTIEDGHTGTCNATGPIRPLADTARDTLTWAKTRPDDHRWGAGLSAEKEQRILDAWKAR